jgi:integrase
MLALGTARVEESMVG